VKSKLVFLSIPYNHPDPEVIEARMVVLYKAIGHFMGLGLVPIAPCTNHAVLKHVPLPTEWAYWQMYSETLLGLCGKMVIIRLEGWETSTGVTGEIAYCKANGIPVDYIDPGDL